MKCVLTLGAMMMMSMSVLAQEAAKLPSGMKVISANVRYLNKNDGPNGWEHRRGPLIKWFKEQSPDLLGLQEVLAEQQDAIAEGLGKDYVTAGVGRDDGVRKGEFSSIFVKAERFEMKISGTFWLSDTPEKAGSVGWDAQLPRICTYALLKDKKAGVEFLYANTHFDHRGKAARENAAKLLVEKLPKLAEGRAVVLSGDFNSAPDSPAYKHLSAAWEDLYRQVNPTVSPEELTAHGFKGTTLGQRIDYVFATKGVQASKAVIDRTKASDTVFLSDHYFVVVELK